MTRRKHPTPNTNRVLTGPLKDAVQADIEAAVEKARKEFEKAAKKALDAKDAESAAAIRAAAEKADSATTVEEVEDAVADLPNGQEPADDTTTEPRTKKTAPAVDEEEDSEPNDTDLAGRVTKLERRVKGHDRRHENAEANLDALNGAVGITTNPDGAWVPIPDGQLDRNSRVQQHLGYERDKDGNVTFNQIGGTSFNYTLAGIVGAVVWLVAFLSFWIFGDATISKAIVWSLLIGLGAGLATGAITAYLTNKSN